ncbi:hypothetical protein [Steroidobacter sp.]|uniref:hypothetical protein n=1 Tax=Steroidobacter sp. TaxID=1978227 RepID=UPI001A45DE53|nr:hypothetical protein [Steroidobacter sp.]MBL8269892.1 hypothetical protein [Steroidobacter sp.]
MNQQRPPQPPQQQQRSQPQSRPAPAPAASADVSKAAPPPLASTQPTAPAPGGPVAIEPVAGADNDASLNFEWRAVELGGNRSFGCTVSSTAGNPISVKIEQLSYQKTLREDGAITIAVIPTGAAGTPGKLTARDETTGASAEFTWQWQPLGKTSGAGALASKLLKKAAPSPAKATKQSTQGARAVAKKQTGVASTAFFGQQASGRRFAFILDMSGSMAGTRWATCTRELVTSLQALSTQAQFFVVLFSSSTAEPPGQSGWMDVTADNVASVIKWVSNIHPDGGTYPAPAFKRVFSLGGKPDAVYFLTDGELYDFDASDCARLRAGESTSFLDSLAKFFSFSGRDEENTGTVINTISLDDRASGHALEAMAEESGGQYVHISSSTASGETP